MLQQCLICKNIVTWVLYKFVHLILFWKCELEKKQEWKHELPTLTQLLTHDEKREMDTYNNYYA